MTFGITREDHALFVFDAKTVASRHRYSVYNQSAAPRRLDQLRIATL